MNHTLTWMKFDLEELEQQKDLLLTHLTQTVCKG